MATPNKFNKGDKVIVTRRNGAKVTGIISGWDYNVCTFEVEYDVDYLKDDKNFTMICVPQTAITSTYKDMAQFKRCSTCKLFERNANNPKIGYCPVSKSNTWLANGRASSRCYQPK